MKLFVPPKYDGIPAVLQNIERAKTNDGLLEGIIVEEDLTPAAITQLAGTLLEYFTGQQLEERYDMRFLSREEYPRLFTSAYADGLNLGPFCFIPIGHPLMMTTTAFHELGHAMFPSDDVNAKEAAAVYVSLLFTRKLVAEQPMLSNLLRCFGNTFDDINARDLLDNNKTPTAMFSYSGAYVREHPQLKHFLKKGTHIEIDK